MTSSYGNIVFWPLFRIRSWNNVMYCVVYYLYMDTLSILLVPLCGKSPGHQVNYPLQMPVMWQSAFDISLLLAWAIRWKTVKLLDTEKLTAIFTLTAWSILTPLRTCVPETVIKGRDKYLHHALFIGYDNLSLPLIPASGTHGSNPNNAVSNRTESVTTIKTSVWMNWYNWLCRRNSMNVICCFHNCSNSPLTSYP